MKLDVDYVSDLHLLFYIKEKKDIKEFVKKNIAPKVQSNILVIAGDICELIDYTGEFLFECSKYYEKIIFTAGNHDYYLFNKKLREEFDNNSLNKIKKLNCMYKDDSKITFLDRNSSNKGLININEFSLAGDTLWYTPTNIIDWTRYYPNQNDSRYILTDKNYFSKIRSLHEESISWYNNLPNDLDLIITHIPPLKIKNNNRGNNCCYYTPLDEFKSKTWIYGHDHKKNRFTKNDTLFLSNPWGYYSGDFNIRTLNLTK